MSFVALGIISVGTTLATGLYQGQSRGKQARRQYDYTQQQIDLLGGAGEQLTEAYGMKTGLAQEQFGTQMGQLGAQTGRSLYDIGMQGQQTASQSGMAFSGSANQMTQMGKRRARQDYGFGAQGLQDVLGEKLMGIEEWYGGEQSGLEQERLRLEADLEEYRAEGWGKSDITRMFGG